ncbi:MAG: glycosyltransferase family 2 protein [Sphingobacteriales bacterium]|nr:MAG: glycosyltransferase family 2 protein [Sphingobacteriales bacterium]
MLLLVNFLPIMGIQPGDWKKVPTIHQSECPVSKKYRISPNLILHRMVSGVRYWLYIRRNLILSNKTESMKISVCIPQYNRIAFLLKSLEIITRQTYRELEIVISDDCSTDNTQQEILDLIPAYKYPVIYHRNQKNLGYDKNYRQCIELATGEYVIVIGNDDTLNPAQGIEQLAEFLIKNDKPDLGFCNFIEESSGNTLIERAQATKMLGTGYGVAMQSYSCFSFVGGLIYKKESFNRFNSSKHDGSIYAQMYLGSLMVAAGCRLFSIHEPLVIKDIVLDKIQRNSYKDTLPKSWKEYRVADGGLPSVMNVLIDAFRDAGVLQQSLIYSIFKRIYTVTFPFWIVDYKENGSFAAAFGLVSGLKPGRNKNFALLNGANRFKIRVFYNLMSITAMCTPVFLFNMMKQKLYRYLKK